MNPWGLIHEWRKSWAGDYQIDWCSVSSDTDSRGLLWRRKSWAWKQSCRFTGWSLLHELWVVTEWTRLQIKVAKMSFLPRVDRKWGDWPFVSEWQCFSFTLKQSSWGGLDSWQWCLLGEMFWACPNRRRPWGRTRTCWRDTSVSCMRWTERVGLGDLLILQPEPR